MIIYWTESTEPFYQLLLRTGLSSNFSTSTPSLSIVSTITYIWWIRRVILKGILNDSYGHPYLLPCHILQQIQISLWLQAPHMGKRHSLSSSKTPIQEVERRVYRQQGNMVKKTKKNCLYLYLQEVFFLSKWHHLMAFIPWLLIIF